jgi:hypothetical protein
MNEKVIDKFTMFNNNRNNTLSTDNLQASVESWITNIDSLEIYSLDKVLSSV